MLPFVPKSLFLQ